MMVGFNFHFHFGIDFSGIHRRMKNLCFQVPGIVMSGRFDVQSRPLVLVNLMQLLFRKPNRDPLFENEINSLKLVSL